MHGHQLIIKNQAKFDFPKGGCFLEIGTTRLDRDRVTQERGSTIHLARMAKKLRLRFTTVDVEEQQISNVIDELKKIDKNFDAIVEYGQTYIRNSEYPIWLIYLDAFDFFHDHHPKERHESYARRGTEITNENCWKMHLECAEELFNKMPIGGFVCFDDVLSGHPKWEGKGKYAIPKLLKNGFVVEDYVESIFPEVGCVLLKRIE